MKQFVMAAALIWCGAAHAQQADCAKFDAAIEQSMKVMASSAIATGPKAAAEAANGAAAAANIQSNLLLMQAHKCKLPTEPITARYYVSAAAMCSLKESFGPSADTDAACDTSKWQRKN